MHRSIALFVCIFAATATKTNALSPEVLALSGHNDLMNQNYQGAVDKYQGALDIFQALDANGLLAQGMAQRVSIVTVLNGDQPLSGLDPSYPSTGIKRDRCSDGVQNGNETGVDCGGSCSVCPVDCVFNKTPCTCTPSCDSTCSCTDTITITTPAAGRGQACPSSTTETFTGEACVYIDPAYRELGAKHGWDHYQGICEGEGRRLCTREEYCPGVSHDDLKNNENDQPIYAGTVAGNNWAPIWSGKTGHRDWITMSTTLHAGTTQRDQRTCQTHIESHNWPAMHSWGDRGHSNHDVFLCCQGERPDEVNGSEGDSSRQYIHDTHGN